MRAIEVIDGRRQCAGCGEMKPVADFYPRPNRPAGTESRCKTCQSAARLTDGSRERQAAYGKRHYEANRQRYLDYGLRNYGITREQYDDLSAKQGGVCALCGLPPRVRTKDGVLRSLAVDHDHTCCPGSKSCGRCVRGLLCAQCNSALGLFDDSPERLEQALAYLAAHRAETRLEAV